MPQGHVRTRGVGIIRLIEHVAEMLRVRGKGEAVADRHPPGVHADHFAVHRQQRTAAVAARDGSRRLEPFLIGRRIDPLRHFFRQVLRAADGADDPRRDREIEADRVPDGDDIFALSRRFRIGERQYSKNFGRFIQH